MESTTFTEYYTGFENSKQGDIRVKKTKYSATQLVVSGNDQEPTLIDLNNLSKKCRMVRKNDGAAVSNEYSFQLIPELTTATHVPALASSNSAMIYYDTIKDQVPTSSYIFFNMTNRRLIYNTDIVGAPVEMIQGYCYNDLWTFYDSAINQLVCVTSGYNHDFCYIISSDDGGVTFDYRAQIPGYDYNKRIYNCHRGSDGSYLVLTGEDVRYYASLTDFIAGTAVVLPFLAAYHAPGDQAAYNSDLDRWMIVEGSSSAMTTGNIHFFDGTAGTYTTHLHADYAGANVRAQVESVSGGFLFFSGFDGKVVYYTSASTPTIMATPSTSGVMYSYFDEANSLYLLSAGSDSKALQTYVVNVGSITSYFLPNVPDSGDGRAYIRVEN